ncbi:MAG: NifU family protein [Planctomycetes bacterium]|nr:NifU family protein [Planctomycetota bacterium]
MAEDATLAEQFAPIERLLSEADQIADPQVRDRVQEIVRLLLDFHGAGLARMVEHLESRNGDGRLLAAWAEDELVGSLLLLHGLHPVDAATRVRRALESVRPYLASHGGNVELLGVDDGVVRLRLQGSCDGCPSSAATLRHTIESAIYEAAPDIAAVEVDGLNEPPTAPTAGFVALDVLTSQH